MKPKKVLLSLVLSSLLCTQLYSDEVEIGAKEFVAHSLDKIKSDSLKYSNIQMHHRIKVPGAKDLTGVIMRFTLETKDQFGMYFPTEKFDSFFVTPKGIPVTQAFDTNGTNLMSRIVPSFDKSIYYDKKRLLAGDSNATHKIMVFSDPLCPFCREQVPDLMDLINEYPKEYAIYLFDYPLLNLHPGSGLIIAAKLQARDAGVDISKKIYSDKRLLTLTKTMDSQKVAKVIEEITGFKIDHTSLKKKYLDEMAKEMELGRYLGVSGTPEVFIDNIKTSMDAFLR